MDKVHESSDSECYTSSSESFRFYFIMFCVSNIKAALLVTVVFIGLLLELHN
jgi:hypothetical protein